MAISPPSDIVLDVARAVEPAGLEAAKAQLARRGGAVAAEFRVDPRGDLSGSTLEASRLAAKPDTFVKFEAMVMQSFIQTMLPQETASVYGGGLAGDMWKGLMAEQIAGVMAERGGIGIADRLLKGHYIEGEQKVALSGVGDASAEAARGDATNLSQSLVNELQRKLTSGLISDTAAEHDKR
ncbi:MAG TPA: rod-binding protein [Rhizobiaceae bacterium]|nr:rod-binding protein [Rhizobiaceae bacterium]